MEKYKEELSRELSEIAEREKFSTAEVKKKLILLCVRTILTVIIYYVFWEHAWVRWTLWLYIPLVLFNLFGILFFNKIADRKINKLRKKLGE